MRLMITKFLSAAARCGIPLDRSVVLCILLGSLLVIGACRRSEQQPTPDTPDGQSALDESKLLRLRNVALAYLEAERNIDAAKAFDELIALLPAEPMAHANRGLVALRESKIEEAQAYLAAAAQLAPDNADIALQRSLAAVYEGHDDIGRTLLDHAVARNPRHLRARWALIELLKRDPDPAAADAALTHLNTMLKQVPQNVLIRLALARLLLERGELQLASEQLDALDRPGIADGPLAKQFLDKAKDRIAQGDAPKARSAVIALDNVLKPSRAWQDSLAEIKGPPVPVAEPIWDFLVHRIPEPESGPRMIDVTFEDKATSLGLRDVEAATAALLPTDGVTQSSIVSVVGNDIQVRRRTADGPYELVHQFQMTQPSRSDARIVRLLPVDWNNDRRIDVVCGLSDGSVRLCVQNEDGSWREEPGAPALAPLDVPTEIHVLLPWDADQDGDLDILVGRSGVRAALLRNNGDGTFAETALDLGLAHDGDPALIDAAIFDLDEDGDVDLITVNAQRTLIRFDNQRSGRFAPTDLDMLGGSVICVTAADFDSDGWLDIAFVTSEGSCRIAGNRRGTAFDVRDVGTVDRSADDDTCIQALDFDNDGWLDYLVVADGRPQVFRNTGGLTFRRTPAVLPLGVSDVVRVQVTDHDFDGDLDLFVTRETQHCSVWENDGANLHGWQKVKLDAIVQGGQRNNSYGLGGFIELRAGRAYQKRIVTGPVTHFGLGTFGPADAIRVVWPNGVPQNILLPQPNELMVEKQTLKGSCPFLLVYNTSQPEFVTDLLWRSPLGMKINAQTVAQITTTEDYVKVQSRQLQPRNGRYELGIAAALWETIFVDEVELWAVDHPAGLNIFTDERLVAPTYPPFQIHVVGALRTPVSAVDHRGRDVLDLIATRDRRRVGGFAKGHYQGIAEMHYVDLDLGPWDGPQTVKLIASGWIMPTDTSINVAISQGSEPPPVPLSVSVADGAGGWIEAIPNAGFPAGKLKTIVLDLSHHFPTSDHHVRLRTNLEVYWDRIVFALGEPEFTAEPVPLEVLDADLRHLGFPTMVRHDAYAPEVPDYSRPLKAPQWRDLHGYHTRYGDVGELLAETDDRYVIMNAGDEIRLSFEAGSPPPEGWVRDFILFTDGWVKDGDWNTVASKTVGPLPYHGMRSYPYPEDETPPTLLPSHPDWLRYHTRYVTSDPFRDRMRRELLDDTSKD